MRVWTVLCGLYVRIVCGLCVECVHSAWMVYSMHASWVDGVCIIICVDRVCIVVCVHSVYSMRGECVHRVWIVSVDSVCIV